MSTMSDAFDSLAKVGRHRVHRILEEAEVKTTDPVINIYDALSAWAWDQGFDEADADEFADKWCSEVAN